MSKDLSGGLTIAEAIENISSKLISFGESSSRNFRREEISLGKFARDHFRNDIEMTFRRRGFGEIHFNEMLLSRPRSAVIR